MSRLRITERGSVLLPVVVAITLLAAITFMLSYQGVSQTNVIAGEFERDRLRYVAEAGLAHARSQLALNASCENYADIPKTSFAGETYSVNVNPSKGSPVKLKSSVELADGEKLNLSSKDIATYQPATTVALQVSATSGKDTFLEDSFPDRNYGSAGSYKVESAGVNWRPLLEFDLSKIPAGATIQAATLELKQLSINAPGQIFVHRLTRDWAEGTKNGGGAGDGASWNTFDGTTTWATPGGEFDSTVYGTADVSSGNDRPTWNITTLVQEWVSGTVPNHGLMLKADSAVRMATYTSRDTNNPPDAPKLTIVYACECGKTCDGAPAAGKNVLLVVVDPLLLTAQETAKQTLIESWGHTVSLIDDGASQAEFDAAVAINDVAYVGEDIASGTLATKLREAAIGVVIEEEKITDEFGISTGETTFTESSIEITDNTHYITQPFSLGALAFATTVQPVGGRAGTLAPGLTVLAEKPSSTTSMLDVLETGAALADTGTAAGRRVKLPWGGNEFDINSLNADGQTIMKRAIEWAAGEGGVAGPLPIAHWKLDETSGTVAVDSIGGNDGNLNGNAKWGTGAIGGGLVVDYADGEDYVEVPNSPALENVQEGDYTLAAWFRPDSTPPGSGADNDANYGILIKAGWHTGLYYTNANQFALDQVFDGNSSIGILSGNTFSPGSFHHVAGVVDRSSGTMSLYVNGQLEDTQSFAPGAAAREYGTEPWRIGIAYSGASSWGWAAAGAIDDVRIYDFALSATEVAELATTSSGTEVVYVVSDPASPSFQEQYRQKFMIDWGFTVSLLDDNATETEFATLLQGSNTPDVIYVSQEVSPTAITAKLGETTIGIVNESRDLVDDFGFASTVPNLGGGAPPMSVDTSHYITSTLTNPVAAFGVNDWYQIVDLPVASGVQSVGTWIDAPYAGRPALMTIAAGDQLIGGTPSSGRRVQLPMGSGQGATPVDINGLTADGRTIIRRSIEWAAGAGADSGSGSGGGGGGSGSCDGTFRDNFDTRAWNGSNGSLSWATDWIEVGESDGATSGDTQVMNDQSDYQLRTRDNNNGGEGVEREADLSGASSATLSYDYRRMNLDNSNDYTSVEISANGDAGPWTELTRHDGSGNDSSYQPASHDISAHISANTRIRFLTAPNMGGTDTVWFDNIEIQCTP